MIDCENKVFNDIATALRTQYTTIKVYGEYVDMPSSFPCVTLIMEDNYVYEKTRNALENHARVMFEVNVYSNSRTGKKAECKGIAQYIDGLMLARGFNRDYFGQTPNQDSTVYRMTLRYTGVVRKESVTVGETTTVTYYIAKR